MWMYDKKLEYPVKITKPDGKMAKLIITQYGGPDGELAASLRYLSQKFSMITPQAKAILNDIGSGVSEMRFSEVSELFIVSKVPATPFATVKLHLCGSIFK